MSYTASQKYLLCKMFLFKFAASSLYCLQEPPENNNSDSQHLTRPYFLDSCGSEMLLWRCYITKEASGFRNKVSKIILAKINVETFDTFKRYAISCKHLLQTLF